MTVLEMVLGVTGALLTGGVGWWARYVTSGASKAHKLASLETEIRKALSEHEEREEGKFREIREDFHEVREDAAAARLTTAALMTSMNDLHGKVGELHGKVDTLTTLVRGNNR